MFLRGEINQRFNFSRTTNMRQYNRIMLGEHGMYLNNCLAHHYIGASFLKNMDLKNTPINNEEAWRQQMVTKYLELHPDKSVQTARTSIGFLWTICFGLKIGDIVLASNGNGGYQVGEITGDYYFQPGEELSHRRSVNWKNMVIPRRAMSQKLQNSTGSIGTCCNITKYAEELESLINGKVPSADIHQEKEVGSYKERSLHRLLGNYLRKRHILSKTIFHESSNRVDQAQKWVHPDMVGVEFNEFQEPATRALLKAAETKEYMDLFSYELKRSIDNDHQLKEYFFQALSNSNWANYGYLVAFEINEDVMEEMARLNRAFGIGVIKLSPYPDNTTVLFPARKNELDYYTIDKLCRINSDFKGFITKTTKVITVSDHDVLKDVKEGLQKYCEKESCDKGFTSDDEIQSYCNEHHIPC